MRNYPDEADRARALSDLDSTMLVEAAAGTGKTSLLAGRVALLLASGVHPRNIVAITFTELAAGELRLRVSRFVKELLSNKIPEDLRIALPGGLSSGQNGALREASASLDELTSSTIHGFCRALLCSYAVEADVDPGADVLDSTQADFAFRNVFDRWLTRRLSAEGVPDDPIALMARWDPDEAVEILRDLGNFRRRFRTARAVSSNLEVHADRELVEAVREFRRWFNSVNGPARAEKELIEFETLTRFYEGAFAPIPGIDRLWELAHPPRLDIMRWKSIDLLAYRSRGAWGKADGGRRAEQAADHYERCAIAFRVLLGQLATSLVAAFSGETDGLMNEFEDFKRNAAVLDFDDLLLRTRKLLAEHEEVRQAVANRYTRTLVDEFQDTDPVQSEILFLIASATGRNEPWQQRELLPGRLFLVGDPKQAIYRFRGADIACYMEARAAIERGFPGNIVRVTANFRSRPRILEHINSCFRERLGKQAYGYVPLEAIRDDSDWPMPCIARVTVQVSDPPRANEIRDLEAKTVADVCARLIGNLWITRRDGSVSSLAPGDIALLTPARTELWRYERALEDRELPFVSQAGRNLFRRQETQDFVAIVRTLADSRDTLALGAVLRGPLVGLTEEELLDIVAELPTGENPEDIPRLTLNTDPSLVRHPIAKNVLTILRDLRRKSRSTTPLLLLGEALEKLKVRPSTEVRGADQAPRALANLNLLLEKARVYTVGGLSRFARDLQEDWDKCRADDEARMDAHGQAIEIITVHSSKGLEWPVVIPINMGTEFRPPDRFIQRRHDNTLHWMLGDVVPPAIADAMDVDQKESMQEGERLLYVACTRAMDLLILPHLTSSAMNCWARLLDLKQRELPELQIAHLIPKTMLRIAAGPNDQTVEKFGEQQATVARASAPIRWVRPSENDMDRQEIDAITFEELDQVADDTPIVQGSTIRGIVLHKILEELLMGELEEIQSEVSSRARSLLQDLSTSASSGNPDPNEMAMTALRTLALPGIAERREKLIAEIPVYAWLPETGALLSGRADAIAVDAGVPESVFDWKSDVAPTERDRAVYRAQLLDYAKAIGARRGAVVYMSLGQVHWIEAQ
jgi:CRISPR-associated exonuclease Cas4